MFMFTSSFPVTYYYIIFIYDIPMCYQMFVTRLMIYNYNNIMVDTDVFLSSRNTHFIINCIINKK